MSTIGHHPAAADRASAPVRSARDRARRPGRPPGARFGLLALVGLGACTHYVERAESAYGQGRYLEVAEELAQREAEIDQLSLAQRAEYSVYRGLSLLKLGELDAARQWLQHGLDIERSAPGSLAPFQRLQLDQGLLMIRQLAAPSPARATPRPQPTPPGAGPGSAGPGGAPTGGS